jgi:hypothetical protein
MPEPGQLCPRCGEMYVPKKPWQRFCSRECQKAATNAKRRKSGSIKAVPHKAREPKDGLRCRTCADWVDSREGWRLDCKSCSRTKMKAIHSSFMCTRKGCIVCMEATLARSTEFVAAWEAEAE